MADINERVLDMVRRELERNPDISNDKLLGKALRIDPSLNKLSARQFHARYPLQVKRAKKRAAGGGRRRSAGARKAGAGAARRARKGPGKRAARKSAKRAAQQQSAGTPANGRRRRGRPPKAGNAAPAQRSASTGPSAGSAGGRDGVRELLLDFARQVASADGRTELIDVVARVDGWVDRIMQEANG
jgi:hypothetical protein